MAENQPYQALYRRYRPKRFDEVKGQEHVTRPLRNAVRENRVGHAYLFSGPRGTGKTSTARILAMALNCDSPLGGEPDCTCQSCQDIRRGASVDVHELDAASNRKLDEMRDLLSRVSLGTAGRWKVYIIDEVHQLTPDAASALLKTLEDPPSHVVFVLATTDPQKVLPTIRSRTQHYEFRLINADILADLLKEINELAGLGVADEAISVVAGRGSGSARDALSAMDQVAAGGDAEEVRESFSDLVGALAERDIGRVLLAVAEAVHSGREPRRLASELVAYLRNAFLAVQARSLVLLPDDAVEELAAEAHRLGLPALVRAMEVLGQAAVDMRDSVDPRVTLEAALVRLSSAESDTSVAALAERLTRLERRADSGAASAVAAAPGTERPRPPRLPGSAAGPGPGQEGSGDPGARPALGAHRARGPATALAEQQPPPAPQREGPQREGPQREGLQPARSEREGPRAQSPPQEASPARQPQERPPDGSRGGGPELTRDALTKLWGDSVLPGLKGSVKAYVAAGRFLSVEDGTAVFALPDKGLVSRAERVKEEAEKAISDAVGQDVTLELTVDPGPAAQTARDSTDEGAPTSRDEVDQLKDADGEVVSPEQRLLQAFPGAEEVTP